MGVHPKDPVLSHHRHLNQNNLEYRRYQNHKAK